MRGEVTRRSGGETGRSKGQTRRRRSRGDNEEEERETMRRRWGETKRRGGDHAENVKQRGGKRHRRGKTTNRRKGADMTMTKSETMPHPDTLTRRLGGNTDHDHDTVGNRDKESHPIEQSRLALLFFS